MCTFVDYCQQGRRYHKRSLSRLYGWPRGVLFACCKCPVLFRDFQQDPRKNFVHPDEKLLAFAKFRQRYFVCEVRNINFKSAKKLKNDLDQTVDNLDATHAFEPLGTTCLRFCSCNRTEFLLIRACRLRVNTGVRRAISRVTGASATP